MEICVEDMGCVGGRDEVLSEESKSYLTHCCDPKPVLPRDSNDKQAKHRVWRLLIECHLNRHQRAEQFVKRLLTAMVRRRSHASRGASPDLGMSPASLGHTSRRPMEDLGTFAT
jgi:hypothetical protein